MKILNLYCKSNFAHTFKYFHPKNKKKKKKIKKEIKM